MLAATGRGGRRRLPAQLLARDARRAHRHARGDPRGRPRRAGRMIAVLQDLGGPKIRLGPIPGDAVECHAGRRVRPGRRPDVGRPPRADLHLPRAAPTTSRPATTVLSPTARWRWWSSTADAGGARLKVTLAGPAQVAAGDQPAGRGRSSVKALDRQGPARPRLDRAEPGRVRRPVVRPPGRRRRPAPRGAASAREPARGSSPRSRSRRRSPTSTRSSRRPTP